MFKNLKGNSRCNKSRCFILLTTLGVGIVDNHKDMVWLETLAVDPDHQNKGYGKALMDHLESLAKNQHLLVVSAMTYAISLYKKRGYIVSKTQPVTDFIPQDCLTRQDLEMITMVKM